MTKALLFKGLTLLVLSPLALAQESDQLNRGLEKAATRMDLEEAEKLLAEATK